MSGRGKSEKSRAMLEFLSEAQDVAEAVSGDLMAIDEAFKYGEPDPEMINNVFRGWHTLKGLAATFGIDPLSRLAHQEENHLDDIRLGREELTENVLDSLLESVEVVVRILRIIAETGNPESVEILDLVNLALAPKDGMHTAMPQAAAADQAEQVELNVRDLISSDVLEVLTEFEEHRLQTNLRQGRALYKIRTSFELMTIDTELEAIKGKLKPVGEIITYLPSSESDNPEMLDIDVLMSLVGTIEELQHALDDTKFQMDLLVPASAVARQASPTLIPELHEEDETPERQADISRSISEPHLVRTGAASRTPSTEKGRKQVSLRSVSQSVRVDIGKLDGLMNTVGELSIIRNSIAKLGDQMRAVVGRQDFAMELHRVVRNFERRLGDLQEGILEVRMVGLAQMFDRLARTTRKLSRSLGKHIQFVVSGAETEVDKLIIEELTDPLMHIIRNSIDHGIEDPAERAAAGKPETGTVALTAYQKGNHVLIEVEDDGSGIDLTRLVEVAVTRGVLTEDQAIALSHREALNLIFLPGITTAAKTTEISGRGVGMDVVKTNISSLGGHIEVESEFGIGTKFTITMPVTLAIIPALLVVVDGNTYAVPLNAVAEAIAVSSKDVKKVMRSETLTLRGQTLPLCRLDGFFEKPRLGPIRDNSRVVIAVMGQHRLGLVVDSVVGQRDVIIKPLGESLAGAGCFSGVTDIGDQRLALVLDTVAVIEGYFTTRDEMVQYADRWE